ncbi:MAG: DUF1269 domain-containing protein [Gammaproteobacteria bacterium]|nr:DUF1269 domain-containing protein [Gammaproteobacteria bacterium]
MKRRLYFLSPDLQSALQTHNELLLARIPETDMHVICRDDLNNPDLPQADLLQKTDLVHSMQLGGSIGGLLGALMSGLSALLGFVAPGLEGATVLSTALAGIFIGMVSASMVGINIPNTKHQRFSKEISEGKYLFITDIAVERLEDIETMVKSQHPEADMRGIDPTIPAFP